MPTRFVNVDRQTPMLLPPDLREWVADNEMAHLILEAVELCDLHGVRVNERGSGDQQYPPRMMLALLIYCYATGVFGSRRIENATYDSVAVRYLCANTHPDHTTINEFRRHNAELFTSCFAKILVMAREAGVLRLGTVSIDGTRLAGAGSRHAVRSAQEIDEQLKQFEQLGLDLLSQAEAADRSDHDAGGTQLPEELRDGRRRRAKLLEAKARIEQRQQQAKATKASAKASITEPESRTLHRPGSGPPVQGYNAQLCTDAGQSGLIVGAQLNDAPNDTEQLEPTLESVPAQAGKPFAVLVDKGYEETVSRVRVEQTHGVLILCPPQRRPTTRAENPNRTGKAQWVYERGREMEARMRCPLLATLYKRRLPTAEGAFARIKSVVGFRRLRCWGLKAARAEWMLVCLAHNLRVLAGRGMQVAA
jgi:transposase